jgi:hypothetical protein
MRTFLEFKLARRFESIQHVDQMLKLFQNPQALSDPRFQGNVQTALQFMTQEIGDPNTHQAVANSPDWLEAIMEIMQAMPQLQQNPGLAADASAFANIVYSSPILMQAAELSQPQVQPTAPVQQPQAQPQLPQANAAQRRNINPWGQQAPVAPAPSTGTGLQNWPTR